MALFPTPILLATDGSEDAQLAARAAIELANKTNSELHVVHVWSPDGFPPSHPYPGVTWEGFYLSTQTMGELEKRAHKLMDEQVGKIEEAGGNVAKARLRMGRPVEELVGLSERLGAGLVVVGSRGHSGIKRLMLGSVSEGVVRYAACPVLVVRDEGLEAFPDRILLATDGSAESEHAAEVVAEFSRELGSEVHVVNVGPELPVPHFESEVHAWFEAEARDTLAGETKRVQGAGGEVAQSHVRMGQSAEEVVKLAEELGVGGVVVGSRGLSTIKRVVMGSVSESVVRHAPCSVLVVR